MRKIVCGSLLAASAALSALSWSGDARACGGCFIPPPEVDNSGTIVTAHRMALSVSTEQTILWDQIQYTGNPAEFAWVLPVKSGARIDVGTQAFFDVLDAATGTTIAPPLLECKVPSFFGCSVAPGMSATGFGCGASEAAGGDPLTPPDPVQVVSHGAVGPYESVIIHSDVPGALSEWLKNHKYAIPDDVVPVIEAYQTEGFDFAAIRLLPSSDVQQMRPIRVISPGAAPVLPLRMVAAGTGPRTAITLFVIGEGRYTTKNIPEIEIPRQLVTWDFATSSSNYSTLRDAFYGKGGVFFSPYSEPGALFDEVLNPVTRFPNKYQTTNGWQFATVGETYAEQAFVDGDTSSTDCADRFKELADDSRRVAVPCADPDDPSCVYDEATEIDPRTLECDPPLGSDIPLDDLAQAMIGLHPSDVWITRLEANLTRADLANDLVVEAAPKQIPVHGAFETPTVKNIAPACRLPKSGAAALLPDGTPADKDKGDKGDSGLGRVAPALFLGALGLLLMLRRLSPARRRLAVSNARRSVVRASAEAFGLGVLK